MQRSDSLVPADSGGPCQSGRLQYRRLTTLFLLYLAQGLPYGFFVTALPVFLRQAGWSRTSIGFYTLLGLPWLLKPLWAPLVDRFSWPRLGRRKSWVIPCMVVLVMLSVGVGLEEPISGQPVTWLLVIILGINLLAATQDIAVDGLAVDILSPKERGPGNAAQVVGFKVGMLMTGGLLLGAVDRIGWFGICLGMALISLAVLVWVLRYPEAASYGHPDSAGNPGMREIARSLVSLATREGFVLVLVLICTYKMGEALIDSMYKVFLLDSGMDASAIGILCGGWGLGLSLAGSLSAGWLARGAKRLDVLFWVGIVRAIPLIAIAYLPFVHPPLSLWILYPVTLAEHFVGGMLTTVMFAFMMDLCERRMGATHYTVLAAAEVAGKMGISLFSGVLADQFGFGFLFGVGAALSVLWPCLVALSRRRISL